MILTKELLIKWDACKDGIQFCERNKLFGFDLSLIDEINGDYYGFINWLKTELLNKWEYDSNGNKIYKENSDGYWRKWEYDSHGNKIKSENSDGYWFKWEYNPNGNKIKEENSNGDWVKWEYDSHHNMIKEENSNGDIIITETEYYPNGQLKLIGELELPLI